MGIFDGLPISPENAYLREELARIEVTWAAPRFDSLPHVVHILTSKDREGEAQILKDQNDIIEEVVDEVVHAYHSGFNKAIQNYSQILRLFSESAESIKILKVDLAEAKRCLGTRNKQLHQLWYRSVTLRHIISLLDQIEGIAKVPARIEKLIAGKQYYAAVQLHAQSVLMLEREGLQTVGALQDVRSELTKLRGLLFYKVLEDLHAHLYNKGEYSSAVLSMHEMDDKVPTTIAVAFTTNNLQPLSRRTRLKGDNQFGVHGLADGSYSLAFDGHDEDGSLDTHDETSLDGHAIGWLANSTPDEFVEAIRKTDAPLHMKYLQTMVECLCSLGKVAAAGAIICQRLRPTIHEIIISKIKAHAELMNSSRSGIGQAAQTGTTGLHFMKGKLESYQLPKQKRQNGISLAGTLLAVSPVSAVMAPLGKAQAAAKELIDSILDSVVRIFENHVVVGELLEFKSSRHYINTPKSMIADANWNSDSEASVTGGYSIGFSLTVLQSECQQLICEILRATPEAASADSAVQTARLASKAPTKEKRDGSEDGLTFAFRFTDATISIPNQGVDLIRQGWSRRGPNVLQEGYGTAAVLPEQGIYLAASIYRPVLQFTDKVASMLPHKYSQLGNDGLLAFVENFVKDHLLPTMFVDYRKGVQQAISSSNYNRSFDVTPGVVANMNYILSLSPTDRNWRVVLAEKRLRLTPLWREVFYPEGIPLPLTKNILSVVFIIRSNRVIHGGSLFLRILTPEENLCAVKRMSQFKLPSVEEMLERRKKKKTRGREIDHVPESQPSRKETTAILPSETALKASTGSGQSLKKRKQLPDIEEDLENVIIKIPRNTTVMSDPCSLAQFADGLLLEEDESRMLTLGPLESAKRAVARNYETLEYAIFQQRYVEASLRKARELEKSNAALRKDVAEAKASSEESRRRMLEAENEAATLKKKLEVTSSELELVKGSVVELESQKIELLDRLEGVAIEVVIKDRSQLMKEYLSGEHSSWNPRKWIMLGERLEAGLSLSVEETEVEGGQEVISKEVTERVTEGFDAEKTGEAAMVDIDEEATEAPAVESRLELATETGHPTIPVDSAEPVERLED